MSYILDALRRADAERERGAVPSLHAQQYASLPSDDEPRRGPKPMVWVVIGLSAALIAALAWNFLGREAPPPVVAARAPEPVTAPPAAAPAPPIPAPVAASAPAGAVPAPAAVAAAPVEAPKPVRKPVRRPPPPAATTGTQPDGSRVPPAGTPAPPAPRGTEMAALARGNDAATATRSTDPGAASRPAEGGGDARIYALRDLPEEIRRTLPNVAVSGSTYSTDRASRMLMINGQIFHEGDVVSNGLVLQQIKPRGAVFSFKGFRYETGF
jgi:general secretion pathway protein B